MLKISIIFILPIHEHPHHIRIKKSADADVTSAPIFCGCGCGYPEHPYRMAERSEAELSKFYSEFDGRLKPKYTTWPSEARQSSRNFAVNLTEDWS